MELNGKKINFLGDSITEGTGTSDKAKGFVKLIAEREGAVCRNYGIGGTRIARQTTPSAKPKHDRDFVSRVAEMKEDADIVVVFGGTNDFGHGDAAFGEFSNRDVYSFFGALHVLYTSLIEKYPEADIVVITPLHRLNEAEPSSLTNKTLAEYVEAIRRTAEYYSLPVLDLFACGKMQPAVDILREKYMPDGLHPNDAGNEILTHKITNFLKNL